MGDFQASRFAGNAIDGVAPSFAIVGDELRVTFGQG